MIDTARMVLPGERAARAGGDPAGRGVQLLVVDDGSWSLACNRAGELVEFDRADVKWRTAQGKRPWLAGMISDKRVALLDVEALKQLLADQMA